MLFSSAGPLNTVTFSIYRAGCLRVYFLNHPDLIEADRERIASYAGIMTHYTEQAVAGSQDGAVVDLHREMMRLTLKIAVRTLFNVEPDGIREISQAADILVRNMTGARMLMPSVARFLPLPRMLQVRRAVRQLDRTVYQIIDRRRRNRQDSGDLLFMLLEARDEDGSNMDDRQVRDEVLTFLLTGHETTALALSWPGTFWRKTRRRTNGYTTNWPASSAARTCDFRPDFVTVRRRSHQRIVSAVPACLECWPHGGRGIRT